MCFLRPLRVIAIRGKTVWLEKGIRAYYDKKIGRLKKNEKVLVYGNLIIEKYDERNQLSA